MCRGLESKRTIYVHEVHDRPCDATRKALQVDEAIIFVTHGDLVDERVVPSPLITPSRNQISQMQRAFETGET
jgi:hypothetical protein